VILDIRPVEMESSVPPAVIGRGRAAKGVRETGVCPADLHQQIVGSPESGQPAFHGFLSVLNTGRCPEALGRDCADGGKRILDAMMQFPKDELLQLVGGLTLPCVDPGLQKQGFGVDAGLFQQQAEAVVLRQQHDFLRGARRRVD